MCVPRPASYRMCMARLLPLVLVLRLAAPLAGQERPVEITFLDVGQGDAVVIRSPEGRTAMVDAGPGNPLRYLRRMGVESIDLLVASHPHADHIGGMTDVLTARPVRAFMDNGDPHTTDTYLRLIGTLQRLGDVTYLEAVPRTISLGSVTLEVLPLPPRNGDHNNRSVGLVLRHGDFSAFLSGDSEEPELEFWVDAGVVPNVTLLKAPHHGSEDGFTYRFLETARPEVAVVSVGARNPYGHPRPEAMTAFGSVAEHVMRTDLDGHVTVVGFPDGTYRILAGPELADRGLAAAPDPGDPPPTTADSAAPLRPASTTAPRRNLTVTVVADAPGDDHENLNGEYVVVENRTERALEIGRWRLCDLSSRCFRFPEGSRIAPDRRVVVYTGYGTSDGVSFFMNNDRAVWNNDGDEATLYDADGELVVRHVY